MTKQIVREKPQIRISSELRDKISQLAERREITKNDAAEFLLTIGWEVHQLIESGLVLPKAS
ncbi:hypothetical protein ACX27_27420 [Nostoc piscinale CENA21]|uniref:Uncharacterized protein n=1 Tax=Nostoc piscinale CENA21 TaxID=224013 RepID=A0A0M5MHW2_9NOSO|nr:hypothetical protein [Nostoc piscinale]ALF55738.1 hypothetical protein ACX27_27420 [Nostoc piscinale CENA21]